MSEDDVKRVLAEAIAASREQVNTVKIAVGADHERIVRPYDEWILPMMDTRSVVTREHMHNHVSNTRHNSVDAATAIGSYEQHQQIVRMFENALQFSFDTGPGSNFPHTHRMNPTPLVDAVITAVVHVLTAAVRPGASSEFQLLLRNIIQGVIAQNRHRYTQGLLTGPFAERAHAVIKIEGPSGERIFLRFNPTQDISALDLYRCQQLLDGYVPIKERLSFLVDQDLLKYFEQHGA